MKSLKVLIITPLIFFSCSSGSIYTELLSNLSIIFTEPKDISLTQVESIPYSTLQARIGRSENSLIVLEEIRGDLMKWTSSNKVKVYTLNNFVVRLTGVENELENVDLDNLHPVLTKEFDNKNQIFTSFYTFDNPKLFRLPIKTRFYFVKDEEINILGKTILTKVYKEKTQNNLISWDFENIYWIDNKNEIVKSVQFFTPKNPSIHLTITDIYKKPD